MSYQLFWTQINPKKMLINTNFVYSPNYLQDFENNSNWEELKVNIEYLDELTIKSVMSIDYRNKYFKLFDNVTNKKTYYYLDQIINRTNNNVTVLLKMDLWASYGADCFNKILASNQHYLINRCYYKINKNNYINYTNFIDDSLTFKNNYVYAYEKDSWIHLNENLPVEFYDKNTAGNWDTYDFNFEKQGLSLQQKHIFLYVVCAQPDGFHCFFINDNENAITFNATDGSPLYIRYNSYFVANKNQAGNYTLEHSFDQLMNFLTNSVDYAKNILGVFCGPDVMLMSHYFAINGKLVNNNKQIYFNIPIDGQFSVNNFWKEFIGHEYNLDHTNNYEITTKNLNKKNVFSELLSKYYLGNQIYYYYNLINANKVYLTFNNGFKLINLNAIKNEYNTVIDYGSVIATNIDTYNQWITANKNNLQQSFNANTTSFALKQLGGVASLIVGGILTATGVGAGIGTAAMVGGSMGLITNTAGYANQTNLLKAKVADAKANPTTTANVDSLNILNNFGFKAYLNAQQLIFDNNVYYFDSKRKTRSFLSQLRYSLLTDNDITLLNTNIIYNGLIYNQIANVNDLYNDFKKVFYIKFDYDYLFTHLKKDYYLHDKTLYNAVCLLLSSGLLIFDNQMDFANISINFGI